MKKLFLFCSITILPLFLLSQSVGINEDGSIPNLKSILDVGSVTKGLLAPRMTTAERIAIAPGATEEGMIVFDTELDKYMVYTGLQWELIGDGLWLSHLNGAYRLGRVSINNVPITNTQFYIHGATPVGPDTSIMYAYREGSGLDAEGGDDFSVSGIDAGIKAYNYWGNKYSAAIAAYSFLDFNQSAALVAGKQDGSVVTLLGYKESVSRTWAGHFTGDARISGQLGVGITPGAFANLHSESTVYDRAGYFFNAKSSAGTTFGIYGAATGTGAGDKRGGSFEALNGSGTNIALRALASGGATNWAGYFAAGNVYINANLAIGTETMGTGYKLSVNGKIISEEVRIQDMVDWPDYVFAADYPLMSLYELETNIQRYKHLPGVPSAVEIENEGVLVGEMQSILMRKIEELTLYTIAQQKQIDQQQTQINELQKIVLSKKKFKHLQR